MLIYLQFGTFDNREPTYTQPLIITFTNTDLINFGT